MVGGNQPIFQFLSKLTMSGNVYFEVLASWRFHLCFAKIQQDAVIGDATLRETWLCINHFFPIHLVHKISMTRTTYRASRRNGQQHAVSLIYRRDIPRLWHPFRLLDFGKRTGKSFSHRWWFRFSKHGPRFLHFAKHMGRRCFSYKLHTATTTGRPETIPRYHAMNARRQEKWARTGHLWRIQSYEGKCMERTFRNGLMAHPRHASALQPMQSVQMAAWYWSVVKTNSSPLNNRLVSLSVVPWKNKHRKEEMQRHAQTDNLCLHLANSPFSFLFLSLACSRGQCYRSNCWKHLRKWTSGCQMQKK